MLIAKQHIVFVLPIEFPVCGIKNTKILSKVGKTPYVRVIQLFVLSFISFWLLMLFSYSIKSVQKK